MYDALIIGSGPGGLSAAVTLRLRNKTVILADPSKVSSKISKAHLINNYLGIPGVSGKELAERFLDHAESSGVEFLNKQILSVYALGDRFSSLSSDNASIESKSVIIACGTGFGKPYPGETEFLGRGVSYCATCDAMLYRGKTVAVICSARHFEEEIFFLAETCSKVLLLPLYGETSEMPENVTVLDSIPSGIGGKLKAEYIISQKDEMIHADGIFILRESVPPSQLVPGLDTKDSFIKVNRKMETNIPGCFACGDVTGRPFQYIKAAGEGNIAALSASEYLSNYR